MTIRAPTQHKQRAVTGSGGGKGRGLLGGVGVGIMLGNNRFGGYMSIYYGVVKGNQVILSEDANLAEGTPVEVRILPQPDQPLPTEADFKQRLIDLGLLAHPKVTPPAITLQNQTPLHIEGRSLSQSIIEERR